MGLNGERANTIMFDRKKRGLSMLKTVATKFGTLEFTERTFSRGGKKIDRSTAKKNLLELRRVFVSQNVPFGLIDGTLLGAVREKNFIEHDEDTDVFVLEENKEKALNCLPDLISSGFIIGRFDGSLLSIVRDDEYIDIYFYKKSGLNNRRWAGYVVKAKYLEQTSEYEFLGERFPVPKDFEELLVSLYGKDWRIPKQNAPSSNYGLYLTVKFGLRKNAPVLFNILSWFKRNLHV